MILLTLNLRHGYFKNIYTNGHNPNPLIICKPILCRRFLNPVLRGVCLGFVWIRDRCYTFRYRTLHCNFK